MSGDGVPSRMWYLVYSKPNQEWVACDNLLRQGYETYLPTIRNRKRRAGRYVNVIEPMFPRYLFIHLDTQTDNWSPIRSTIGVSTLVRFGQQPARVPDELIDVLKSREDALLQERAGTEFKAGETVRIVEGVMSGYEGIFLAKTGKERVIVLLEIAGKYARVQVSPDQLEMVAP